jgi:hypothetical protein
MSLRDPFIILFQLISGGPAETLLVQLSTSSFEMYNLPG